MNETRAVNVRNKIVGLGYYGGDLEQPEDDSCDFKATPKI